MRGRVRFCGKSARRRKGRELPWLPSANVKEEESQVDFFVVGKHKVPIYNFSEVQTSKAHIHLTKMVITLKRFQI